MRGTQIVLSCGTKKIKKIKMVVPHAVNVKSNVVGCNKLTGN